MVMASERARTGVAITLSGEIYLKSRRTRRRFVKVLQRNLAAALGVGPEDLDRFEGNRFFLAALPDGERLDAASRVFGVGAVEVGVEIPTVELGEITEHVVERWGRRSARGTFAVRVRRRGDHPWRSSDAERVIGAALETAANRVDLENPDHLIGVRANDTHTWITDERRQGPQGLPLGTQEPVLCLISGGFDSVIAAWMLMSRGCPVHFIHLGLDCAQADHALAVARTLHDKWGYGAEPMVHLLDFQPVKEAIRSEVDPRMRQIVLKTQMVKAASLIAETEGIPVLATGESLGQVSSQTLTHLRSIDQAAGMPVLRPLLGMDKETIVGMARRVGTADLSARAKEVCDLSAGRPVAVEAPPGRVQADASRIGDSLIAEALSAAQRFRLEDWMPGLYTIGSAA